VLYRKSAATIARYFAEGLAYASSPEIPMMMRDPLDIRGVGRALKRIVPTTQTFARSDHYSFWEQGIPAIMITDTGNFRNPNYHEETDTPDTLDYDRLADIVSATAVAIARIATLKQ
jgi:Predicted aminopeptidases